MSMFSVTEHTDQYGHRRLVRRRVGRFDGGSPDAALFDIDEMLAADLAAQQPLADRIADKLAIIDALDDPRNRPTSEELLALREQLREARELDNRSEETMRLATLCNRQRRQEIDAAEELQLAMLREHGLGNNLAAARERIIREVGAEVASRAEELAGIDLAEAIEGDRERRAFHLAEAERLSAEVAPLNAQIEAIIRGCNEITAKQSRLDKECTAARESGDLAEAERLRLEGLRLQDQLEHQLDLKRPIQDQRSLLLAEKQIHTANYAGSITTHGQQTLDRLSTGYVEALAEVRDMGGVISNFHRNSDAKATASFRTAAAVYPSDWLHLSEQEGPMVARFQKSRAHYSPDARLSVRSEEMPKYEEAISARLPSDETPASAGVRGARPLEHSTDRLIGTEWEDTGEGLGDVRVWRLREMLQPADRKKFPRNGRSRADVRPSGDGWKFLPNEQMAGYGTWYRPGTERREVGSEPMVEIKTSPGTSALGREDGSVATSVHELGHRMEHVVPGIAEMEHEFRMRRWLESDVADEQPKRLFPGSDERARDAGFVTPYVGKLYDGAGGKGGWSFTEVVSVGAESLFGGAHGGLVGLSRSQPDLDHRNFVLGLFASLGRA